MTVESRARRPEKSWTKFSGLFVLFVVLPILIFGVVPAAVAAYDRDHPMPVECEVESARPASTSSRSLRGVGSSERMVRLETAACDVLLLQGDVKRTDIDTLVAEFEPAP